ncbi:hypothetical protein HNR42_000803 [Deinobacterium chartae]|uniref:DUF2171 domain-containing protein n=1 Tax=Deinobacterium chartae TaxID=521158 RepID=A0A841HYU0_9DEIO|nr:DUF2171 domain-containing protein [Deinobacterium chartae]MBB6097389.1 hypothetical protein [Deinobacterium chartae]
MDNIFSSIREHMPVLDVTETQVGTVDRLEDDRIKLTRDENQRHHWIPLEWVDRVDENVHLKLPLTEITARWQEEHAGKE